MTSICLVCGTPLENVSYGKMTCGATCRSRLRRMRDRNQPPPFFEQAKGVGQKVLFTKKPKPKTKDQLTAEWVEIQKEIERVKAEKSPLGGSPRMWVLQQEVKISDLQEKADEIQKQLKLLK